MFACADTGSESVDVLWHKAQFESRGHAADRGRLEVTATTYLRASGRQGQRDSLWPRRLAATLRVLSEYAAPGGAIGAHKLVVCWTTA